MLFSPPNMFGLVLNISLRTVRGVHVADLVRDQLVRFAQTFTEEDLFYLSSTAGEPYLLRDIVESNGKRVSAVGNWQPQEVNPRLLDEFSKAARAIHDHADIDGRTHLCYITDRYRPHDEKHLVQGIELTRTNWHEIKVMTITLGRHHSFAELELVCNELNAGYIHLASCDTLCDVLTTWREQEL